MFLLRGFEDDLLLPLDLPLLEAADLQDDTQDLLIAAVDSPSRPPAQLTFQPVPARKVVALRRGNVYALERDPAGDVRFIGKRAQTYRTGESPGKVQEHPLIELYLKPGELELDEERAVAAHAHQHVRYFYSPGFGDPRFLTEDLTAKQPQPGYDTFRFDLFDEGESHWDAACIELDEYSRLIGGDLLYGHTRNGGDFSLFTCL